MELEESNENPSVSRPKQKVSLIGFFVAFIVLVLFVTQTSPGGGGPITILFFLTAIFILSFSGAALLITEVSIRLLKKEHQSIHLFYSSILIATGIVFLVGLQTLGQLQPVDVILVVIFEVLLNFYILRRF